MSLLRDVVSYTSYFDSPVTILAVDQEWIGTLCHLLLVSWISASLLLAGFVSFKLVFKVLSMSMAIFHLSFPCLVIFVKAVLCPPTPPPPPPAVCTGV